MAAMDAEVNQTVDGSGARHRKLYMAGRFGGKGKSETAMERYL